MGTNYYAHLNGCTKCGRYDEVHIGKSKRTVRIHPDLGIYEFADWRKILDSESVTIWDEYGTRLELDSSIEVHGWLDEWQRWPTVEVWALEDPYAKDYLSIGDYLDRDGYHVSSHDFC